jgi:RHS repeat-associated protein
MDGTSNSYPDWIQVNFNGNKTIDEIDVFTLQDNYSNPSEPTESMTFSLYGLVNFQVQYWNGLGWVTVSGGSITGNNKVWKKINFSQITTSKIRVNVTSALANYSRVTEVEAWGPGVGINYTYDASGNVTNDGFHSYTYDAANRLVSIDSGAAQFKYDHQSRRVSRIIGSTFTHYVWEGSRVIGEHDATTPLPGLGQPPYQEQSARLDYVSFGDRLISNRQRSSSTGPWVTQYFVNDRWSERLVLDSSGNIIGRQAHLPFGEDFGESGAQDKRHFTSYERDGDAALDYAVNRSYASGLGRFNSADPYEPSGLMVDPQSWNRFVYVQNDPIHNVDPQGLFRRAPDPESPDTCDDSWSPSTPGLIIKHYSLSMKCSRNAVGVATQLKARFTWLVSWQSKNQFITFQRAPVTQSTRLWVLAGVYLFASKFMHVFVIRFTPTGWTFGTESDHAFFPGTINFNVQDVPNSDLNIKLTIDLNGFLNGWIATGAYYFGFSAFEDATWERLGRQVRDTICNLRSS